MKINILAGSDMFASALRRYLMYVMEFRPSDCRTLLLGRETALSKDILDVQLWLVEAWNIYGKNEPEGFRTLYVLAGRIRCLLLFLDVPAGFPENGPFWCNPIKTDLKSKLNEVIQNPPPTRADFDYLKSLWPDLLQKSSGHHHKRAASYLDPN